MELWSAKTAAIGFLPVLMAASGSPSLEARRANEDAYVSAGVANVSVVADLWKTGRNSSSAKVVRYHSAPQLIYSDDMSAVSVIPSHVDETPVLRAHPAPSSVALSDEYWRRVDDGAAFLMLLDAVDWRPSIWADEGELVFEWIADGKHAIVSFEGDGTLGYTTLRDGVFSSGELVDPPVTILPDDLREYLSQA